MLTRRTFIEAAAATLALAGCSQQDAAPEPEPEPEQDAPAEPEAEPEPEPDAPASESGALVLYFSRADENYNVGVIEEGNTAVIAKMIAERTGADLFELVPKEPYPESYDECCDVALEEKNRGARPELEALPDLTSYGTVFLGFPCWWGDLPMCVYTAIEALTWEGKTIHPFNTHEGSGESGMFSTLAVTCTGSSVTEGLTMTGSTAQNEREEAASQVEAWLAGLGY